jgi:hypothetical protein
LKIFHFNFSIFNAVLAALLCTSTSATADTLWVKTGNNVLELPRLKVTGARDGEVTFQGATGNESSRPLASVVRIELDDDPSLSAAEEAFAAGNLEAAVDPYAKALKATRRQWLRPWIARRLMQSATKSNRFDAAAMAYVALVVAEPGAEHPKPALPDGKSTYLTSAYSEVQNALAEPKLSAAQKQPLLSFLLDLQRARGDEKAAADTTEQLLKLGASVSSDPSAGKALAALKLQAAQVALEAKQYRKAIDEIQANRALFTTPADQADALFCIAQAQEGLAGDSADPAALADVALAYLRVVAHFEDARGQPHVAQSLLRAAAIQEKLKESSAAMRLYEQVAAQFPDDPAAEIARKSAARLKAAESEG